MNTVETQPASSDLSREYFATGDMLRPASYFRFKSYLARLAAFCLLVPGLPIIGALVILVRLTSRGPALFRQARVGRHGKVFTMIKIRTMVIDAEQKTGPVWSTEKDPRVTPLGRWLRKLHLDELPQLFNVIAGDMALVGPRPERPEIASQLAQHIPGYWRRLAVLPGVTGLAQVNLPPDTDLDSVRHKQVLDLAYVQEGSLLLDLRMIGCSALRIVGVPGDMAMQALLLKRTIVVPPSWYTAAATPTAGALPAVADESWSAPANAANEEEDLQHAPAIEGLRTESWPALRASP